MMHVKIIRYAQGVVAACRHRGFACRLQPDSTSSCWTYLNYPNFAILSIFYVFLKIMSLTGLLFSH